MPLEIGVRGEARTTVVPENTAAYGEKYAKFKNLYTGLKEFF